MAGAKIGGRMGRNIRKFIGFSTPHAAHRCGWRLRSPAWLLATQVGIATPTRIARLRARAALRAPAALGVPVALIRIPRLRAPAALGKPSEAVVAVGVRNEHVGGRLARDEPALRLVAQHRDELGAVVGLGAQRSEEHTSELQSRSDLVCRLL